MRRLKAALAGAAFAGAVAVVGPPAQAQNQFLGDVQHFFEGMTPNGSMRQAYEAGRKDEYTALMSDRARFCAPESYGGSTQPYLPPYAQNYSYYGR